MTISTNIPQTTGIAGTLDFWREWGRSGSLINFRIFYAYLCPLVSHSRSKKLFIAPKIEFFHCAQVQSKKEQSVNVCCSSLSASPAEQRLFFFLAGNFFVALFPVTQAFSGSGFLLAPLASITGKRCCSLSDSNPYVCIGPCRPIPVARTDGCVVVMETQGQNTQRF